VYAIQYHPEKVRYDRSIEKDNVVNSEEAFAMSKKLADFFVDEAKKNNHWLTEAGLNHLQEVDPAKEQPIFYHNSSWVYLFTKPKSFLR